MAFHYGFTKRIYKEDYIVTQHDKKQFESNDECFNYAYDLAISQIGVLNNDNTDYRILFYLLEDEEFNNKTHIKMMMDDKGIQKVIAIFNIKRY